MKLAGALETTVDADLLGWWLCERQVKAGGLNGRPEKFPDVCYSWWVLSSLSMQRPLAWIDQDALARFILRCQDPQKGGISGQAERRAGRVPHVLRACGAQSHGVPGAEEDRSRVRAARGDDTEARTV